MRISYMAMAIMCAIAYMIALGNNRFDYATPFLICTFGCGIMAEVTSIKEKLNGK